MPVKQLPQRVADHIRSHELLKAGHRTGIAVSGGLDSVALLRIALDLQTQLGIVLAVVHFNHRLRDNESEADEKFVAALAEHHGLEFHRQAGDVSSHASEKHLSLEAAARELRYRFFHELLSAGTLDRIATAHTLDDQAETVILRLARGAGTRGLAGIYPELKCPKGSIIRPLLKTRRSDLEAYLNSLPQNWREDSSNDDLRHSRNRVRHNILPMLERDLNPSLKDALADTAEIARDEEHYWNLEVERVLPTIATAPGTLKISQLVELPMALRRRMVRRVSESLGLSLEQKHVEKILEVAAGSNSTELPGGWSAIRRHHELVFEHGPATEVSDYEYALPVPGRVEVPETRATFYTEYVASVSDERDRLNPALLGTPLTVRNWRAGDRFWPGHSKSPKKVKELLQERKITGAERALWPMIVSGAEVVWLRGFPVPAQFRATRDDVPAVVIREVPM